MTYLQLLRREPAPLAYGALHFFFSGPGQTFLISLFVPYFLATTQLGRDSFNAIYLAATLGSAFTLPWVGHLLDRWRIRTVSMVVGGSLLVVSLFASQVSQPWMLFPVLYGLRLLGQGMMPLIGSTATARYFREGRGKALSLINFGLSFSELSLPLALVWIMGAVGWPWGWAGIAGLVALIFLPAVWLLIPWDSPFQMPGKEAAAEGKAVVKSASRAEVMRDPYFYLLVLVYLFLPLFMTGFMLNQARIGELVGATAAEMALGITMFGGARMVANVVVGPLIDRHGARRVFAWLLLPVLVGVGGLWLFPSVWTVWLYFLMGGISSATASLSATALWAEVYGTDHLGAIKSLVSTFLVLSTAVGPMLVGLGLDDSQQLNGLFLLSTGVVAALNVVAFVAISRLLKRSK